MSETAREEALRLLAQGRELEAIKVYRDATNAGLKEAVAGVRRLKREAEPAR